MIKGAGGVAPGPFRQSVVAEPLGRNNSERVGSVAEGLDGALQAVVSMGRRNDMS